MTSQILPKPSDMITVMAAAIKRDLLATGKSPIFVGLQTGGVWVRDDIVAALNSDVETGDLDISFFRDDYSTRGLPNNPKPSAMPMSLDERHIVLVDDVLFSGRTIRAAMNALFEIGRPLSVRLAILIDRGQRELPVQPDYCGHTIGLPSDQRVYLSNNHGQGLQITIGPNE